MASRAVVDGSGQPREKDPYRARRRVLQAQHRATLAGLLDSLRDVVCPDARKNPTKWQLLRRAKRFLQQQERQLSRLLRMKEVYQVDTGGPCSMEEVREEYRNLYSFCSPKPAARPIRKLISPAPDLASHSEGQVLRGAGDVLVSQSSICSLPNILEFEGYLFFYRQTLELLVTSGVLTPEQTGLAVVSEAISGLWATLPGERRAAIQACSLEREFCTCHGCPRDPLPSGPGDLAYTQPVHLSTPLDLSQVNSQGLSGSSGSTNEEDLFQDAYEMVQREMDTASENSPTLECPDNSSVEELKEIYSEIMGFVKTQLSVEPELTEELCLAADYEAVFLRCTETFEDDDL
ncbi:stimulated by retinoic acid gene 8 protein homolog [Amia ocellicauda]|uniref:stimulated by retinoic acid gene 8 protein homolog n=1 Tax=Amia ocellicauda TaxID=2972642 RepID=UPI003464193A